MKPVVCGTKKGSSSFDTMLCIPYFALLSVQRSCVCVVFNKQGDIRYTSYFVQLLLLMAVRL